MKLCAVRVSVLAVLLFSPIVALAVEQNSAVKVTSLLKTTSGWDGKQIVYPEGQAEMTALLVEIAPGESTGWHQHPVPSFGFLLEGTLEITLMDGRIKRMEQGEALSEVTDTMHIGRADQQDSCENCCFLRRRDWQVVDHQSSEQRKLASMMNQAALAG